MQNNDANSNTENTETKQDTAVDKKQSLMGRIFKKLGNNGVSLGIKTIFTALSILAVISSGGGILLAVAILSTTILVSAIGKTLVDAQVLKDNDKLNKLDKAIDEFSTAKGKYDGLSQDKKDEIKSFLNNNNKDDPLKKILNSEETAEATIKHNDKLVTFDKVNNSVRSFSQIVKLLLIVPYALIHGSVQIVKALMRGQAAVVGAKTIKKSENREETVKIENKINEINDKIKANNISSNDPNEIAKQTARLNAMVELCKINSDLTEKAIGIKLQEKNPIEYKKMSGADAFFKSLLQNTKAYTDITKSLDEIRAEINTKPTPENLKQSEVKGGEKEVLSK